VKVVICVPRWSDSGRRDEVWRFVQHEWISKEFPWPVFEGFAKDPGDARNLAAVKATGWVPDWDVAIFWDSDNLAHKAAVAQAVDYVRENPRKMAIAADSFMYLSKDSSDRIMDGETYWFPKPYALNRPHIENAIFAKPCTGVYAVSRELWDATGGFVPGCDNWGWEDLIFYELCTVFGDGVYHIPEHIILHLWHPPAARTLQPGQLPTNETAKRNYDIWRKLQRMRRCAKVQPQVRRYQGPNWLVERERVEVMRDGARKYLRSLGHEVPDAGV
jgi:hypothetical protein